MRLIILRESQGNYSGSRLAEHRAAPRVISTTKREWSASPSPQTDRSPARSVDTFPSPSEKTNRSRRLKATSTETPRRQLAERGEPTSRPGTALGFTVQPRAQSDRYLRSLSSRPRKEVRLGFSSDPSASTTTVYAMQDTHRRAAKADQSKAEQSKAQHDRVSPSPGTYSHSLW